MERECICIRVIHRSAFYLVIIRFILEMFDDASFAESVETFGNRRRIDEIPLAKTTRDYLVQILQKNCLVGQRRDFFDGTHSYYSRADTTAGETGKMVNGYFSRSNKLNITANC